MREGTKRYLEDHLEHIIDKPYEIALITYALHLLKSERSDEAFQYLMDLSTNDGKRY